MTKIEYGNFYKFIVSIGVVILSLSILIPWLFLKESFDLVIDNKSLTDLTAHAQSILTQKQIIISKIISILPWLSIILAFSGIIIMIIGILKWRNSQLLEDEKEKLNIEKLKKEIELMTPLEIMHKSGLDFRDEMIPFSSQIEEDDFEVVDDDDKKIVRTVRMEEDSGSSLDDYSKKNISSEILENVTFLLNKLKFCLSNKFDILIHRKIGTITFDAILINKTPDQLDYIVEIKYLDKYYEINELKMLVLRNILSSEFYTSKIERKSRLVMYFVYAENNKVQENIEKLKSQIYDNISKPIIKFFPFNKIKDISCSELIWEN